MSTLAKMIASALLASGACSGGITYTSEALFVAAAGSGLAFESFENPLSVGSTQVDFTGGNLTCTASVWCPGFFGVRNVGFATDGVLTAYFSTPSIATFTFDSPITAFAVDLMGPGSTGVPTDVTIEWGGNSVVLYSGVLGRGADRYFVGITDSTPFTSVSFSGTATQDAMDFDRLRFGTANPVPEPSTVLLLGFLFAGSVLRVSKG